MVPKDTRQNEDPTNVPSISNNSMKPSTMGWSVGEPLSKLDGHLLGNLFGALVDLVPHEQLTGDNDHSAQNMIEWMIFY